MAEEFSKRDGGKMIKNGYEGLSWAQRNTWAGSWEVMRAVMYLFGICGRPTQSTVKIVMGSNDEAGALANPPRHPGEAWCDVNILNSSLQCFSQIRMSNSVFSQGPST